MRKNLNKALFRQIGIFFMFPLLLAIIHSIFGIKFCNFILRTFGKNVTSNNYNSTIYYINL